MADTGFKFPTANGSSVGNYGGSDWTDQANAYADDASYATFANPGIGGYGGGLATASYYTFNFGIPNGSLINGVEIVVKGKTDTSSRNNLWLTGYWASGVVGSGSPTYGNSGFSTWTTTDTEFTYGGATTNLVGSQMPSAFSNGSFFVIIAASPGGTIVMMLNSVKVKVYYTEPTSSLLPFFYP